MILRTAGESLPDPGPSHHSEALTTRINPDICFLTLWFVSEYFILPPTHVEADSAMVSGEIQCPSDHVAPTLCPPTQT